MKRPFVMFDDASGSGRQPARLYANPVEIVEAVSRRDIHPMLDRLQSLSSRGLHLAGYLGYEAGHALEPRLAGIPERQSEMPVAWFGAFETCRLIDPDMLLAAVDGRSLSVAAPAPTLGESAYAEQLAEVLRLIEAGDIYQANVTFPVSIGFDGHPLSLYARLRRTQRMPHGAIVWTGRHWVLSASPELFFCLNGGILTTKPMKGTATRHPDPANDDRVADALSADPKNRAENLMITDLIRNDLSRVAEPGSVTVSDAFSVERYPTVHQMTTTVRARLAAGYGSLAALRSLFPCGSVTGAPKIRAIEVIDAVERRARGVYTGSVGWVGPAGDASFNVAIRTVTVAASGTASMAVGSGIVADSDTALEWRECLAKMAFVTQRDRPFHLFETMACNPDSGVTLLPGHIERLSRSAAYHGFAFDRHEVRNLLQAVIATLLAPARLKLTLARDGSMAVSALPLPPAVHMPEVTIVPLPVPASDVRLYHKTSDRRFYDDARTAAGTFEVVFQRGDGAITEGSFTNVFVERGGILLTPPIADGLLGGVLRQSLISEGRAREQTLSRGDLESGFLLGNALRGLFPARLVDRR